MSHTIWKRETPPVYESRIYIKNFQADNLNDIDISDTRYFFDGTSFKLLNILIIETDNE